MSLSTRIPVLAEGEFGSMKPLSGDANKNLERPITFPKYSLIPPNHSIRRDLEPDKFKENAQVEGKTLSSDGTDRVIWRTVG